MGRPIIDSLVQERKERGPFTNLVTRLRVTVKDVSKVAELEAWKAEGAMGLIKKDEGIQAVYGPKADVLKSDINDIL